MTQQPAAGPHEQHDHSAGQNGNSGGPGHRWMMIVCCIPMIAIAVILVATGVAGAGFLFVAAMCTLMMALMMMGGHGGNSGHGGHGGSGHGR